MSLCELDKFYTKKSVAKNLIKEIDKLEEFDLIIEPSAGNGSFFYNINHPNLIGLDLKPEGKGIKQQDWFKYKINKNYKKVLIIGNPPFGKRNKLSIKFLRHAFSFKNVYAVAFVLPNVFKKYTLQKHIPKNFYINKIKKMPKNSFLVNNRDYNLPTSFFVITKNNIKDLRQKTQFASSDFIFTNNSDFDFFVFGSAPKNIIKYGQKKSKNNKGYYIKSLIDKEKLINNFKKCDWKGHSSASGGVYWMTKIDILENYVKNYNKRRELHE